MSEHRTFGNKIRFIPGCTRYVLADSGYDNNEFAIESNSTITITGKRFLCPQNSRGKRRKKSALKGKMNLKGSMQSECAEHKGMNISNASHRNESFAFALNLSNHLRMVQVYLRVEGAGVASWNRYNRTKCSRAYLHIKY